MPNLQNWLNAWVKVNAKHAVVAPPEANNSKRRHTYHSDGKDAYFENSIRTNTESTQSTNSHHHHHHHQPAPADPELLAIRKFKNGKHRRRLNRTNSFSDLIREKAKHRSGSSSSNRPTPAEDIARHHHYHGQQQQQQQQQRHESKQRSTEYQRKHQPPPPSLHNKGSPPLELLEPGSVQSYFPEETVNTGQQHESNLPLHPSHDEESSHSNSVLWGVAGFFGTDVSSSNLPFDPPPTQPQHHSLLSHNQSQQQPHLLQTARYALDTQHGQGKEQPHYLRSHHRLPPPHSLQQQQSSHPPQRKPPISSSSSYHQPQRAGGFLQQQKPAQPNTTTTTTTTIQKRAEQPAPKQETGLVVGGVRLPFFSAASSSNENKNNEKNNEDKNPFGGKPGCTGCKVAEAELQHAQESLEYMRGMAIRKEYCCPKCGSDASQNKSNPPLIKNSSQQLMEVTARHKKQVEQLMKERNHWQRNMHLKLEKYANLCRNMNSESSLQSEKSQALQDELKQTRLERDEMAAELEKLRADVQVYEKEREEHRHVQQAVRDYENQGLNQAEQAIAVRDEMIAKLSARLETTLDTLAMEREQQRQRRQIIFPPSVRNGNHGAHNSKGSNNGSGHHSQNSNNYGPAISESYGDCSPSNLQNNGQHNQNKNNEEEAKELRQQLLEAQQKLESAQLEAKQRETALMFRCETLETQLNRATTAVRDIDIETTPPVKDRELQNGKMDH